MYLGVFGCFVGCKKGQNKGEIGVRQVLFGEETGIEAKKYCHI